MRAWTSILQALRLAAYDLRHERWLALGALWILAASLAPVCLFFGLERGLIGGTIDRMDRDPIMRRITPSATGANRFDAAWFERVRAWPEVAFIIPAVRYAAALVDAYAESAERPLTLELFETATGDPMLFGAALPTDAGITLSALAAQRLNAQVGSTIRLALQREREGQAERSVLALQVASILPPQANAREVALVSMARLAQIEAWRDGHTVPELGETGSGPPAPRAAHARFRLHAQTIRDVATVLARLQQIGVTADAESPQIAATLRLQSDLRALITLIAGVSLAGAAVALCALQIASVKRKRRDHALLRLVGYGRGWLMTLPALNALVVALGGVAGAWLLALAGQWAVNAYFSAQLQAEGQAIVLTGMDLLRAAVIALALSILPAIWAGAQAARTQAADELREH
ncbi:MAG: ABC transporter permease [Burkholderiaceae bacterium]